MRFSSSNETKTTIGKPPVPGPVSVSKKEPIAESNGSQAQTVTKLNPNKPAQAPAQSLGAKAIAYPQTAPPKTASQPLPQIPPVRSATQPLPQIPAAKSVTQALPQFPVAKTATQTLPSLSSLQGSRSSFSKEKEDLSDAKKEAAKSSVNVARFGGLAAGNLVSKETRALPAVGLNDQNNRPLEKGDRLLEASITAARNLLKQCREAGLIAMEEAVKLIPKPSELENYLQLEVICRKIGASSPSALQRSICDSMGLPIFPFSLFPLYKKNIPPAVMEAFKAAKIIPLGLEYSNLQDGRRHGHITVGAEHPFLDELVLEICNLNELNVLFAFVVVLNVEEINSNFGGSAYGT